MPRFYEVGNGVKTFYPLPAYQKTPTIKFNGIPQPLILEREGVSVAAAASQGAQVEIQYEPENLSPQTAKLVPSSSKGRSVLIGPNGEPIFSVNTSLPKFHAKLLAGLTTRVLIVGDSVTLGGGAGTGPGQLEGASAKSSSAQLAKKFSDNGQFATDSYTGGNGYVHSPGATYTAYDPRLVLVGGASFIADGAQNTLGGLLWTLDAVGEALQFTPVETIDSATIYYNTDSTGEFAISFKGTQISTQAHTPAADIRKVTVTFPRGTGPLEVKNVSGVNRILGIEVWDSTANALRILRCGQYGDRLEAGTGLANNTKSWRGGAVIRLMAPDVVVLNFLINSAQAGLAQLAPYKAALTKACDDIIASGAELVLVIPHALGSTAETTGVTDQFRQVVIDEAYARKCLLIDLRKGQRDFGVLTARGLMFDNLHDTEAGYSVQAEAYYNALRLRY